MAEYVTKTLKRRITIRVDRQYVLVVGSPRSGTTLLASMIGCHTQVGIVNEDVSQQWLNKILSKPVAANKLCIPNQIQMRPRGRLSLRLFKKLGWIEEAPRSSLALEEYLEIPTLRVLAIIRNGDDVVSSMTTRGRGNLRIACHRWVKAVETIHELRTCYPERVMVVAFEELVAEPQSVLEEICRFLQLPFETGMVAGYLYNPRYPEDSVNKEKAHRHLREQRDFKLQQNFPETHRKYEELAAGTRAVSPSEPGNRSGSGLAAKGPGGSGAQK